MKKHLYLALFFSLFSGMAFSQKKAEPAIDRIEPPFWWVDMVNPALQIMVYGSEIASLSPEVSYEGITLKSVTRVQSPNYLFLDFLIGEKAKAGSFQIEFKDPKGKTKLSRKFELKPRNKATENLKGFDNSDVMYLITPDRFANGDSSNDTVEGLAEGVDRSKPGGRHGGDIKGISDNLKYIADLGCTAIWLNPVLENDQPEYSYHGYSTTDFYEVDARFGTNEEYVELVEKARKMGIKVIMDLILNHCGSGHWWMKDLPTDDWVNHSDWWKDMDSKPFPGTNHQRTVIQDIHASEADTKAFSDGWFVGTMPDMNQRNQLLADYLIQNTIWWIEYAGLAGIRMDTYPYPDKDFMTDWTCRVMDEYPEFNIVGEEWSSSPVVVAFWQRGKENPNGYTSCLPGLMDFPLNARVAKSLADKGEGWEEGWIPLYKLIAHDFLYADPDNLVIFPDNHDMDRFYTQVGEDLDMFKLGMAFYATMRGIPQLYYGTEMLMTNPGTHDHGIIRSDFPGGWEGDSVNAFTGKGVSAGQIEATNYIKKVYNWRKGNKVVHSGEMMHYAPENGIYVLFRYNEEGTVMTILSRNAEDVAIDPKRFYERISTSQGGTDIISGKSISFSKPIMVPAKSAMIIEVK